MTNIILPNNWRPRTYQKPLWKALEGGCLRAYEVAHRRWGKDDVCLHWEACSAFRRVGNYWHMLPEATQARKAIWDAINPHTGKRRIDEAFPLDIRKRTVDQEMKIEFANGSIWQVLGSDNYNSYVGAPPVGVVFSEWALADPAAWAYTMPILEENGGFAFFITTPRGRNHAADFYKMALETKGWFCEKQPATNTGVFSSEQLARIRAELIAQYGLDEGDAKYEQEYLCSFDAALPGSYYGREMNAAENAGRISGVPWSPGHEVIAVFDLGHGDSTGIVFIQIVGREPRIIDYHESSGQSIDFYARLLREKPYPISRLILPHDADHGRLSTGISYEAQFRQHGFQTVVLPKTNNVNADINIARALINQVWFDAKNCARLLDCLRNYHRKWDEKNKLFKLNPNHNWASNGADAFRYTAVAFATGRLSSTQTTVKPIRMDYGGMSL